jgi:hypothetical protein
MPPLAPLRHLGEELLVGHGHAVAEVEEPSHRSNAFPLPLRPYNRA